MPVVITNFDNHIQTDRKFIKNKFHNIIYKSEKNEYLIFGRVKMGKSKVICLYPKLDKGFRNTKY